MWFPFRVGESLQKRPQMTLLLCCLEEDFGLWSTPADRDRTVRDARRRRQRVPRHSTRGLMEGFTFAHMNRSALLFAVPSQTRYEDKRLLR